MQCNIGLVGARDHSYFLLHTNPGKHINGYYIIPTARGDMYWRGVFVRGQHLQVKKNCILEYGNTPYLGMARFLNGCYIKSHIQKSAPDYLPTSMSHISHCTVLPLTLLDSVAEVPDWQVAETGKSSTFFLCQPG